MKHNLCVPCAIKLSEKREVQLIEHGRDNKITCDACGRRRYGNTYNVSILKSKKRKDIQK